MTATDTIADRLVAMRRKYERLASNVIEDFDRSTTPEAKAKARLLADVYGDVVHDLWQIWQGQPK